MKLYVRIVDLELHFANTLSNAKMAYVLNVDLDEWTNLGIHEFSSWDHLGSQKLVLSCKNFKIQNLNHSNFIKWKIDQKTYVDLDEFSKLGIHDFSRWNMLGLQKLQSKCHFFKSKIWLGQTWSNEPVNDLRWKNFEYLDYTTYHDLHLIHKPFLPLKKC
jgi:hypothetical protein